LKKKRQGPAWGVVTYYVVMALALWALFRWVPGWAEIFAGGRLQALSSVNLSDAFSNPDVAIRTDWPSATMAMVGALIVVIPVAWVYMITKQGLGFDPSVVQTMIILPVAVSGIVLIVQSSIPLAFSLAGIVAAVRFRNTLKDTKDAVYVFLAIGVGLAAGVQAFAVALVMSIVFNLVVLALWHFNIGNIYQRTVDAVPDDKSLSADSIEKPFQGTIRIHSSNIEAAAPLVEATLANDVKRWQHAGTVQTEGEAGVLDYFVRFKKKKPPADILTTLQQRGIDLDLEAEFTSLGD
jgi:hypothetical protein